MYTRARFVQLRCRADRQTPGEIFLSHCLRDEYVCLTSVDPCVPLCVQELKDKLEGWKEFVVEWTEEERVRMKTVFKDLNGALQLCSIHIHSLVSVASRLSQSIQNRRIRVKRRQTSSAQQQSHARPADRASQTL